jgi:hypothetical protein
LLLVWFVLCSVTGGGAEEVDLLGFVRYSVLKILAIDPLSHLSLFEPLSPLIQL